MHDANGIPMNVGDEVELKARVVETWPGADICNAQVRIVDPITGEDGQFTVTLNSKSLLVTKSAVAQTPPDATEEDDVLLDDVSE